MATPGRYDRFRAWGRCAWHLVRAVWAAAGRDPWRAGLGVIAAFALAWAALAAAPRAAADEQWERLGSLPASGPVRQIVADSAAGGPILYAIVERWGMFISPDGGQNWLAADRYLPRGAQGATALGTLALAASEPHFLLVALAGSPTSGQPALFKSGDSGLHWVPRRGLGTRAVDALAVAPDNVTYAASANRLYRSSDGGDTWFEEGRRPTASDVLTLAAAADALYVGSSGDGLWLTADRGASWRSALDRRTVLALATPGGGRIYAGADDGLYCSGDGGASWLRLEAPAVAGTVVALAASGPDQLFAATAGGGLHYSADGGANWQALGNALLRHPVTALAVDATSPRRLYVGTRQGLWRCTLPEASAAGVDHAGR